MSHQSSLSKPITFTRERQDRPFTRLDAESAYYDSEQEPWEVADDLDAEQEVREAIDDKPEDWAPFERDIDQAQYELDGLMP